MLKFILKNDPLFIFIAPLILVAAMVFSMVTFDPQMQLEIDSSRFDFLSLPSSIELLISAILAGFSAFLLNQFVQVLGILKRISNMPLLMLSVLFWMFTPAGHHWEYWLLVLMNTLLFFWAIRILEEPSQMRSHMFNIGVLIGLMSILDAWSLFNTVIVLIALFMSSSFTPRRLIILLLGVAIPYYFINAFLFLFDQPFMVPSMSFDMNFWSTTYSKSEVLSVSMLVISLITSFFLLTMVLKSSTLREKKKWRLIVIMAIGACIMMMSQGYHHALYFLLVPFSTMLAKLFLNVKRARLGNALVVLLIALIILVNT